MLFIRKPSLWQLSLGYTSKLDANILLKDHNILILDGFRLSKSKNRLCFAVHRREDNDGL